MLALLWKIMTWCHHDQITLKSQTYSRVPQCDGLPSIQSNKQNGHCIRRCSNSSVKWFIPHVDLFATHLNHKVPLYVSPVPDRHAWEIDAQNIIWSGPFPSPWGDPKIRQLNCLIVIAPGCQGCPSFGT